MGNEQTSIDEQKEIMEKFPDSKEQIFNFYTEENNESNKEFKRKKDHHKTLSMKIDAESRQKLLNKKNEETNQHHKSLFSKHSEAESNISPEKKKEKKKVVLLDSNQHKNVNEEKFERRRGRSISLVEKKKFGSQVFKDELKIKVNINSLINKTQRLTTMKYKVNNKI